MSAEQAQPEPAPLPLPPGLDLLWGRRERGKRGPRPGLSVDAIVDAAVRVADDEGLEAVSMARVASELGFTTMSLYRHVASKDELLQLMWNASAAGAEKLALDGDDWRARLLMWATIQRDMLDRHPWITQMPMVAPPLAPNSLHFVERGMAAFDGTGLPDADRLRVIGLISSYTLSEARMAYDAARAIKQARAAGAGAAAAEAAGTEAGQGAAPAVLPSFEALLRELIDEQTYPHLYRLAWAPTAASTSGPADERAEFMFGLDRILDGVQVLIDQAR
jgi:AcrR family transcriptional regulator